ncbi:TELO2-interacting protein 2 [Lampris incognitus]|uniref:TELO2-interacting protein 2 n=1 Tax=Lampris incognitus TaxID=2546036 RepID=UPI0024B61E59|nr:TELO2-interacting protein 2 [Lampris incognitus]
MDLPSFLHHFQLSSSPKISCPSSPDDQRSCPPITEVLGQLQEKLIDAAGKASNPEATDLIGRSEELFKKANLHWLFSPDPTNQGDGQQNCGQWAELQKRYVGVVQSLCQCAALPVCETDSGSLPATSYQHIPARALSVCSALSALLDSLVDWERRAETKKAETQGEREGVRERESPEGAAGCNGGLSRSGNETAVSSPCLQETGGEMELNSEAPVSLLHAVGPLCCVFAVTHFQDQPWTSATSREAAWSLMELLLQAGGWKDHVHLLTGEEKEVKSRRRRGMFGGIMDILQPDLTRERWQCCEAVKLVFSWALLQTSRPALLPHLPRLLPPCLLLTDHHRPDNSLLGIRCLRHLLVNTPRADLLQYNRAEVIYQALYKHLYTTDPPLVKVVLSCLLDLLSVLEKPPSLHHHPSPRKPCRHDDVLRLFLTYMEMEHKVALRRIYASALPKYIDRMGVAVSRHLRRMERVVVGYLEVGDPPEEQSRLWILEVLEKIICVAWPRMEGRVCILLRCLLRLLVDVSSDGQMRVSVRAELTRHACRCLTLLDCCTHGKLQPLLQQVDSSCASDSVLKCFATVTTATAMSAHLEP